MCMCTYVSMELRQLILVLLLAPILLHHHAPTTSIPKKRHSRSYVQVRSSKLNIHKCIRERQINKTRCNSILLFDNCSIGFQNRCMGMQGLGRNVKGEGWRCKCRCRRKKKRVESAHSSWSADVCCMLGVGRPSKRERTIAIILAHRPSFVFEGPSPAIST